MKPEAARRPGGTPARAPAVALAAAALAVVALAVPSGPARAGETALSFRGPRPERVWSMTAPARVVLDFPAAPAGHAVPEVTAGPGAREVRRSEYRDLDGMHARVVVVLDSQVPYWVTWKDSQGALNLSGHGAPASQPGPGADSTPPRVCGAKPARQVQVGVAARLPAPRMVATASPASRARGARDGSTGPGPGHGAAALKLPKNPRLAVRQALARRDAPAAAAVLDSCAGAIPADTAATLYARLALLEMETRAAAPQMEAHARRALQLGAESVRLDLCLGRALDRGGNPGEAGRWFRRATQITADPESNDPDRRAAFFLWADALYRHGDSEESLGAYAEAMHAYPTAPECPWALYQSAKLALRLGRTQEAAHLLQDLQARYPQDYWTAQARARMGTPAAPRSAAK
jgi:hypothetical protein